MAKAAKKQRRALTEEEQKLATVVAALEKDYGDGILQTIVGTPSMPMFERQIPSGSISLDIALGIMRRLSDGRWQTGYAPGRIMEIFGGEGSGKTTLCLQMAANAQALGIRVAYLDMEHAVDICYAQRLGVDMSKLYFSQPSSGEQCMSIADQLIRSGLFGMVIIDSVAALVPEVELEGEVGDAAVGAQARLMSTSLRKLNTLLSEGVKCNLVFTNQEREKIGVKFGSPKTTPGGKALKFYAQIRIETWRGASLKSGDIPYGQKLGCRVIKNKSAPPFQQAEADLIYGKGIDYIAELVDLCSGRGIVSVNGSWYSAYGSQLGQGRDKACDKIRSDGALAYRLYNDLLTAVMADRGYTPEGQPIPGAFDPSRCVTAVAKTFVPTSSIQPATPPAEDEGVEDDETPPEEDVK